MDSRHRQIEQSVGARIRLRRTQLGYTQQQLAERLDVTYQQVHKYERGANRISAARLFDLSDALGVDVSYFFEDVANGQDSSMPEHQRLGLDLARNFSTISDSQCREALARLCRAIAKASDD